jgi:hypothetical protein
MGLSELHPHACLYAQSIIGETLVFTDWVQKVLKKNGELPMRGSWSESIKDLERKMREHK